MFFLPVFRFTCCFEQLPATTNNIISPCKRIFCFLIFYEYSNYRYVIIAHCQKCREAVLSTLLSLFLSLFCHFTNTLNIFDGGRHFSYILSLFLVLFLLKHFVMSRRVEKLFNFILVVGWKKLLRILWSVVVLVEGIETSLNYTSTGVRIKVAKLFNAPKFFPSRMLKRWILPSIFPIILC